MKNSILIIGMFMMIFIMFSVTPVLSQITNFIPRTIYYQDLDGDGYGNPLKSVHSTKQPLGYVLIDGDCDDTDSKVTSSLLFTYYPDRDQDGLGNGEEAIRACSQPKGYVMNRDDCDDNDPNVGKGILYFYYRDLDGDGFGDPNFRRIACQPPKGYVNNNSDCDDSDPNIKKGNYTIYFLDEDMDGYGNVNEYRFFCYPPKGWVSDATDCDDHNPNIGKSIFNYYFKDNDKDGYPDIQFLVKSCEAPVGFVLSKDYIFDCDDNNRAVGAGEFNSWFIDRDQDGLGDASYSIYSCLAPKGFVDNFKDCDDSNSKIGEARYYYVDNDNDGYGDLSGSTFSCGAPKGYVDNYDDCDDNDKKVGSGVNKQFWLDYDRDGLGDPNLPVSTCKPPKYGVENNLDCDDKNPNVLGVRYFYQDLDNDGFGGDIFELTCKPDKGFITITGDCNDKDSKIYPGAKEICNGLDDNCNGSIDEGDVLVSIVGATNGYYLNGYLCANANPRILKGNPAGGTFSIDGIVTTILDPANFKFDGIHKIEYALKADDCLVKVYAVFKKFKVTEPIIYGLKENYFQSEAALNLSSFDTSFVIHGNSNFGVFSIDGVKTKLFNPSALDTGVHIITFTIIEGGCQRETNKYVRIDSPKACPFFPIQGICYKIVNKYSHKVLTVKRGSLSNGAIVTQSDFNNYPYQKWNISKSENGTYSIYSLNSTKQIEAYSPYLGTAVLQRDTTSNFPSGSWKIACTDRVGYYKIINYNNGHVLDIMAHTESTGAQAITWYWTASDFQYWQIIPVDCNTTNSAMVSNPLENDYSNNLSESDNVMTVFPNPAHDHTTIKTKGLSNSTIFIYDPFGRIVYKTKIIENTESIKINLSHAHFGSGLYIVKAEGEGELITRKLLVN